MQTADHLSHQNRQNRNFQCWKWGPTCDSLLQPNRVLYIFKIFFLTYVAIIRTVTYDHGMLEKSFIWATIFSSPCLLKLLKVGGKMKILLAGLGHVQTDGRSLWNNAALSLIWMKPVGWHMQGYSKKSWTALSFCFKAMWCHLARCCVSQSNACKAHIPVRLVYNMTRIFFLLFT